jgi:hypothetical protein
MLVKILFLHGWQSVPGGVKPTFLRSHGHEVINPALPDEDFAAAVRIAQAEFDRHQPAAVVGSSRGGAVAHEYSVRGHAAGALVSGVASIRDSPNSENKYDNLAFTSRRSDPVWRQ